MRSFLAWVLLAVLTACSSSQSAPRTGNDVAVAASATRAAPATATVRPKIGSL